MRFWSLLTHFVTLLTLIIKLFYFYYTFIIYYNNYFIIKRIGKNDVATLSNRVLSAWVHLLFFSAFDRSLTWQYRCAWTQLNKFLSWPQFWIKKSQNILKTWRKACWTTFLLKVLSTLNFLAFFFSLKMKNEKFASRNCCNKNC